MSPLWLCAPASKILLLRHWYGLNTSLVTASGLSSRSSSAAALDTAMATSQSLEGHRLCRTAQISISFQISSSSMLLLWWCATSCSPTY